MQILGNLYPHNPAKAHKAVSHFKDAAGRSDKDPEVWEMLGELLAPTDPSGLVCLMLKCRAWLAYQCACVRWDETSMLQQCAGHVLEQAVQHTSCSCCTVMYRNGPALVQRPL